MNHSTLFALDFDGVICNSAIETAITGWKAATVLWPDMPKTVPQDLIDSFCLARPMIETGYEAILSMRLLHLGESADTLLHSFSDKIQALQSEARLSVEQLKQLFGNTRDAWITNDPAGWIAMNPLYDGIEDKLIKLQSHCPWYIVTTKQERFVKLILQAHAVELADERIFGLDRCMSKSAVLELIAKTHPHSTIYFAEDRLPTLINVMNNPNLAGVKLIFALWGYNTDHDKAAAAALPFTLQSLHQFLEL